MKSFFQAPRLRKEWQQAVKQCPAYPADRFRGRGLVFSSGGRRNFCNLWVNLCLLRRIHHCSLPVEIWYFGPGEMNAAMKELLNPFDVRLVDGSSHATAIPFGKDRGFALKTVAIQQSSFEEVLFLDTESHPLRDPSFLFNEASYQWSGACFWPDVWRMRPFSFLWKHLDIHPLDGWEWETGQMLLHKPTCWAALELTAHLNARHRFYYHHAHGDKLTYQAAWLRRNQAYAMPWKPAELVVRSGSRRMINQFDFEGTLLFQHRVMSDWDLDSSPDDNVMPGFVYQEECQGFLDKLRTRVDADTFQLPPIRKTHSSPPCGSPEPESPPTHADSFSGSTSLWEKTACQLWCNPSTATMALMGQVLRSLWQAEEASMQDQIRLIAVMLFIDPRLAALLPDEKQVIGTVIEPVRKALENLRLSLISSRGGTGWLQISGKLPRAESLPLLPDSERSALQDLARILASSETEDSWQDFTAFAGLPRVASSPAPSLTYPRRFSPPGKKILILTPVKNAAALAEPYLQRLLRLDYPRELLSLGLLESDSGDNTHEVFHGLLSGPFASTWRRSTLLKHDFNYHIPPHITRWDPKIQLQRRIILARSRNLLQRSTLQDEDWVLWLDADVIDYPRDILQQLLACHKEILHPLCVLDYSGPAFDRNAWSHQGNTTLDMLKGNGLLTPLDAVGGTMLWIHADLHRRGLHFPEAPYGADHPKARPLSSAWDPTQPGEVETEGLGFLANDMGVTCWGLPHLEILHRRG